MDKKNMALKERDYMNRFWSYMENAAVAAYFTANFLTPVNVRNTTRTVAGSSARIMNQLKKWKNLFLTAIVSALLLPASAHGQAQSAIASNSTSAINSALTPEVVALRREGNAAIYNLEYGKAREKFDEIKKVAPQHPAGDIYLAMLIWLEHLNKSRRLQTGLYSSNSSFYAGAESAREESEGDQVDPAIDRAFRDRMAQAKTRALALVARNKNDADAQYFLGAYYGVMAGYEATVARKFFAAMRNGSRSVDAH